MKFNFRASTLIKVGIIIALIAIAPFLVPFTLEFIIFADLMGLEALIVFLLAYGNSKIGSIQVRMRDIKSHMAKTVLLVKELYIFEPRIYLGHATVSGLVVVCASSVLLACAVWLPVMLMSAGHMT